MKHLSIFHKGILALIALLGIVRVVYAQTENYNLDWWTVDGGGGTASGGEYTIMSISGQHDAGKVMGDTYTLNGGFWGGMHPKPTATPTVTASASPTYTASPTLTPTSTTTKTPTSTPTGTATSTVTASASPTLTPTSTATKTPTNTSTSTATSGPSPTPTGTATPTPTAVVEFNYANYLPLIMK